MKKFFVSVLILFLFLKTYPQDFNYVKGLIDTLTSPKYNGRGYVNNGEKTAANYIKKHLVKNYIIPFTINYFQYFSYPINTLPGKIFLKIGNKVLDPGTDYFIGAASPSIKGKFKVIYFDDATFSSPEKVAKFGDADFSKNFIFIDTGFKEIKNTKLYTSKGLIFPKDKGFNWSVSGAEEVKKYVSIDVKRSCIPNKFTDLKIEVENKFFDQYKTQNVAGYIKGQICPDTFIVFTAHYDHLGRMGNDTYFPGANDNASGTALLLDLARYFSKPNNKPYYSIAFLFFSGEEAGLYGSNFFTENPLFPLKNIKLLINFDMIGTGSDGIKVVNSTVFKNEYNELVKLNKEKNYLKTIAVRGEASNSDHYFFYKKGVKAIYIYTLGNEHTEYHTVGDKAEILPLTKYKSLFKLITDFVNILPPGQNKQDK